MGLLSSAETISHSRSNELVMQNHVERRKHGREEIHFNVILVGNDGVQRGCRVLNVSQTGMMLMWSGRKNNPALVGPEVACGRSAA